MDELPRSVWMRLASFGNGAELGDVNNITCDYSGFPFGMMKLICQRSEGQRMWRNSMDMVHSGKHYGM